MTDFDNELRNALRQDQERAEAGRTPDFPGAWARAEAYVAMHRRRKRVVGGFVAAAAVVAVIAVALSQPARQEWQYVNPDDFENSTGWVAPSDVLLPEHRFDIYQEIPVLIESTRTDEGALL